MNGSPSLNKTPRALLAGMSLLLSEIVRSVVLTSGMATELLPPRGRSQGGGASHWPLTVTGFAAAFVVRGNTRRAQLFGQRRVRSRPGATVAKIVRSESRSIRSSQAS